MNTNSNHEHIVTAAHDRTRAVVCPIEGCNFHYQTRGRGWMKHVASATLHPYYHPTVADPGMRLDLFRKEFPAWVGLPRPSLPPPPPPPPALFPVGRLDDPTKQGKWQTVDSLIQHLSDTLASARAVLEGGATAGVLYGT